MGILELKFFKKNLNTPWGFRLVGGADYNEALVVVKVNEQSLASSVGLKLGDVIVRLNNIPTAGLTREDVHDLINQSGGGFSMVVRRGLFYDLTSSTDDDDDEESSELAEILCNSLKEPAKDYDEFGPPPKLFENLAGQETLVDNNNSSKLNNNDDDIQRAKKSKKWSTFLVKPKNRKPVPKQEEEARKILGDPYKVKIIKQPRRNPNDVLNHRKSVQFEPLVTEVEISPRDSSATNSVDSLDERNMMEVEIETSVEINEETSVEVDEDDDAANEDQYTVDVVEEENEEGDECTIKKLKPILKAAPLDIHLDPSIICESSLSLEDQLAAVQRQLLALSQLPSAIQVTLEAVTNQLNKIVLEKVNPNNNNNNNIKENGIESDHYQQIDEENSADEIDGDSASDNNNAEGDLTENEDFNNFDDEFEEECVAVNGNEENLEDATINNNNEKEEAEEEESADPYAGLTEEEKEAKLREEELEYKKQKILEERRKMDWTERPIVLPGGRKWSDAEDVVPKYRQPKMSDEKISKAIEDHSEVIVGKTKGINFLKFEPPPKNLDYLQKSEVYRLIHDMEPPVRGVGARAEKILSENDYYGDKGAP